MAQRKILLDTNSYLRLAKSIHPLLFEEFGAEHCCLYVLEELNVELRASSRLQTKFEWALEPEYVENRRHQLTLSRKDRKAAEQAYSIIWEYVQSAHPGPSRIDARHLAHAFVLGILLVSDDQDLLAVASEFDIKVLTSLELLKLMLTNRHVTLNKVREIVSYWRYWKDVPSNLQADYLKLFGEEPP